MEKEIAEIIATANVNEYIAKEILAKLQFLGWVSPEQLKKEWLSREDCEHCARNQSPLVLLRGG